MNCPSTGKVQLPDASLVNVVEDAGLLQLSCRLSHVKSLLGTRPVPVIVTLVPTGTVNGDVCPFTCNTIGSGVFVGVGVGSASHVITTQFEN